MTFSRCNYNILQMLHPEKLTDASMSYDSRKMWDLAEDTTSVIDNVYYGGTFASFTFSLPNYALTLEHATLLERTRIGQNRTRNVLAQAALTAAALSLTLGTHLQHLVVPVERFPVDFLASFA